MPRGTYRDLPENHLKSSIRTKHFLGSSVLLQRDNARPHTAPAAAHQITKLRSECLLHPADSSDLASKDV